MNKMKKVLWMMACLCLTTGASAQMQSGIVRTLERPGKPSEYLAGVSIDVLEYPNVIVSKKGGKFSFSIPGKRQGESFTVTRVQKKGYSLVDKQLKGRRFAYSSSVPLEIVMVSDTQLENDKKRIEDKAYDKAKKNYDQKVVALEKQLKQKTISEQEYRAKYEELNSNYNNYIQLIDQMAERYATTDYSGMDEMSQEIQACIENADLEQADELINRKGSFDKREQELLNKKQLKEKSEHLSQQLQEDIDKELEDLKRDYFSKYTIQASNYQNDSAAYYLERLVRLDTTDVRMLQYAAVFFDSQMADYPQALTYYQRALIQVQQQYGVVSEEAGFITEFIGLTYDHMGDLDQSLEWHHKALILGTGGASKAIDYGLRNLGLETVFVSRYERPETIQYKNITPEIIKEYNVIVNCTPVGMYPKTEYCPDLPYEAMDSHTILYDLIYNPDETLFMKRGAEYGANVKNGLEMLLLQAFASWEFWHEI